MSTVKFATNGVQVHKGPAYPFFNILRPPPYLPPVNDGNIMPSIIDPAPGTWVASVGTWLASTVYAVGALIIDQNGNAELCTAVAGTGTSASSEPTWPTTPKKTVVNNPGMNQVTWTMLGRVGTAGAVGTSGNWVASFAYLQDDQIRDANGNIQWCIVPGTSAGSAPTWATAQNGITTETSGVVWFNLGPTLSGGYTDGEFNFDMEGKIEQIMADQDTLPIATIMTSETASLGGTFEQVDLQLLGFGVPHSTLTTGLSYGALPTGVQSITTLTTGGIVVIPNYCMCVLSPRHLYTQPGSTRFYTGTIMKAGATGGKPGLGFGREKKSTWKAQWDAIAVDSLPNGARGASLIEQ